ncbi:hypothetical protein HZD82_26670, partial [Pantoea agglomerans]|nr:hypothetical protein [Pantoea agglomerans]
APLELRQEVYIFDTLLERNHTLDVPSIPGFVAYLTVLEGMLGQIVLTITDAVLWIQPLRTRGVITGTFQHR